MWFLSDPIVRAETESEEDSVMESDSELESDGDDALVQSFFISEWFFIWKNEFLIFPPD